MSFDLYQLVIQNYSLHFSQLEKNHDALLYMCYQIGYCNNMLKWDGNNGYIMSNNFQNSMEYKNNHNNKVSSYSKNSKESANYNHNIYLCRNKKDHDYTNNSQYKSHHNNSRNITVYGIFLILMNNYNHNNHQDYNFLYCFVIRYRLYFLVQSLFQYLKLLHNHYMY